MSQKRLKSSAEFGAEAQWDWQYRYSTNPFTLHRVVLLNCRMVQVRLMLPGFVSVTLVGVPRGIIIQ